MEPRGAETTGKTTPCSTRMTTISRIPTDGEDAGSRDCAIESGDMSEQAQSACLNDGSADIVLS